MYAISIVLLLGAVATLVVGFLQEGLTFVFISIGASVASAIFLAAGVFRKRPMRPATAGAPYGPEEGTREVAGVAERIGRPPAREDRKPSQPTPQRRPAAQKPSGRPEAPAPPAPEEAPERPPAKKPAAKKPAAKKPAAKKPSAKKAAAKKPCAKKAPAKKAAAKKPAAKKTTAKKTAAKKTSAASSRSRVVSLPERGTYHEQGCRFVKGRRDTETITLATAKKRDFTPCGVCKPGT